MSRFHADNLALVTLKMKEFAEKEAKLEVLKRLRRIAQRMVDEINAGFDNDDDFHPVYTGNLHDATGVAIYDDGRLEQYLPTKIATEAQQSPIGEEEWGHLELQNVIKQGVTKYSSGLWLVLFSASSYAETVEDLGSPKLRGMNYFTGFWDSLSLDIRNEFEGCMVVPMIGLSDSIPF